METQPGTPILTPLLDLLRSRPFIASIVGALFAVLVIAVPTLAQYQDTLIPVIVTLVLALIGADTVQAISLQQAEARVKVAHLQVETARIQAAAQDAGSSAPHR